MGAMLGFTKLPNRAIVIKKFAKSIEFSKNPKRTIRSTMAKRKETTSAIGAY